MQRARNGPLPWWCKRNCASIVYLSICPNAALGKLVCIQRLRAHLNGIAALRGRHVSSPLDYDRLQEVLVQVIDVLENAILQRSRDTNVVDEREVLRELAEAHATRVGADGNPELGCHEHHREKLVNATDPAAVDLTEPDGPRLKQLLENYAVLARFAGRDAYGAHRLADPCVAHNLLPTPLLLH